MGSGSSKKTQKITVQTSAVAAYNQESREGSSTQPAQKLTEQTGKSSGSTKRITVSYHSKNYDKAKEIAGILRDNRYDVFLISEGSPLALGLREQSVQWCGVFVIVASFNYQRAPYCVELANYAKDKKKPVVSITVQPNYIPSGSVGAISTAWGTIIDYVNTTRESTTKLLNAVKEKLSGVQGSTVAMPTHDVEEGSALKTQKTAGSHVCITFHKDGANVAQLVRGGRGVSNYNASANAISNLPVQMGSTTGSNLDIITNCKVFIPILSSGFERSNQHQEEYEFARANQKQIIPVKGEKFWPSGWLALGIAGKLYYELLDQSQAYTPHPTVPDSNPMNDFIFAVLSAMEDEQSEEEREKAEITALTNEIEKCKAKLKTWPPETRDNQNEVRSQPPPPDKLLTQDTENLPFNYIKYEVTRMTFTPPKPLFDKNGVPLDQKFDVMLSYQWDIQGFVRDMYMELDMKTFRTWMDIWGGMQGNINEAMATAVENSTLLISFLTEKYQQSVNCNLELMYAKIQQKPIIFIMVQPNLKLKDWIQELVDQSLVFEMRSTADFGVVDKGVPKINRLAEGARNLITWAATQPKQIRKDVSEDVFKLQNQLEDALYALAEQEDRKRFETCTRCGAQFEEDSAAGCKKHSAYFMGGNIIAGRWVCCSQREKDCMGCSSTIHITITRKWAMMTGYDGCYQWNPQ